MGPLADRGLRRSSKWPSNSVGPAYQCLKARSKYGYIQSLQVSRYDGNYTDMTGSTGNTMCTSTYG